MTKASSTPIIHFLLAASLFLSCSASDDLSMSRPQGEPHAVEVSMRVGVSAGIVSRELNTWDGAQQVNDMRVYLFRCPQDKYNTDEEIFTYYVPDNIKDKGYFVIGDFDNKTPYYSSEHNGQPEQHAFYFSPFLESGYYYQFLAVGRDDKYVDQQDRLLEQPSFKPDLTTLQVAKMSLAENAVKQAEKGTYNCSEFFSGIMRDETTKDETPILVTDEPPYFFRTTLTATRNVAGLIIYVTNIPTIVETNTPNNIKEKFTPTKLYVEATGLATETKLRDRTAPTSAKIYKTQILGKIDLTAANGWAIDDKEHVFTRPADKEKGWQKNSYLVSNFMMPTPESFMGNSHNAEGLEKVTFYLHYTDDKGHHRYDNIKKTKSTGDLRCFPIEANHLYSLGSKSSTSNDPYDLKKHYEPIMVDIAIEIEPAFEKKHEFETE